MIGIIIGSTIKLCITLSKKPTTIEHIVAAKRLNSNQGSLLIIVLCIGAFISDLEDTPLI